MIKDALQEEIPAVVAIADQLFGSNYLSFTYFEKALLNANLVFKIKKIDDEVVGFFVAERMDNVGLRKAFYTEANWVDDFVNRYKLKSHLLIKHVAVLPKFQNKKIASDFLMNLLNENQHQQLNYWCICWEKKEVNHFTTLLEKMNFEKIKTILAFWKGDSIIKNYQCVDCENFPCTCNAAIYFLPASNKMAFSSLDKLS